MKPDFSSEKILSILGILAAAATITSTSFFFGYFFVIGRTALGFFLGDGVFNMTLNAAPIFALALTVLVGVSFSMAGRGFFTEPRLEAAQIVLGLVAIFLGGFGQEFLPLPYSLLTVPTFLLLLSLYFLLMISVAIINRTMPKLWTLALATTALVATSATGGMAWASIDLVPNYENWFNKSRYDIFADGADYSGVKILISSGSALVTLSDGKVVILNKDSVKRLVNSEVEIPALISGLSEIDKQPGFSATSAPSTP